MFEANGIKKSTSKRKYNNQKIFIVGASVASLVATGETAPPLSKDLIKIGDVVGEVSDGDDALTIGGNGLAGIVASGEGADTIMGGGGVDFIRGGEGADTVTGGAGLDHLVVVGVTVDAGYTLAGLQNLAGSGVDLSAIFDLDLLNNHAVSDLVAGDSIDGGADGAILYVLGKANFANVTLANISKIYLDDEVILSDATLQGLKGGVLTELFGAGVIKAEAGLLDLDGVKVAPDIEIQDVDGNVIVPTAAANALGAAVNVAENLTEVGTFSVTDASAVGEVVYTLAGVDGALFEIDAATGVIGFKAAPDYENAADVGNDNVYDVVVTATDEHTKSLSQNIAINVTDVNEPSLYVINEYIRSGVETLVNSQAADKQVSSSVTALENGGYVVVWETFDIQQDGSSRSIKLQVYDAQGKPVGGEKLVNDLVNGSAGNQTIPDVAGLKNGGFVVSWSTDDPDQDNGLGAVKAQIFDALGQKVGDEKLINTQTDDVQQDIKVVGLENGGFVATWITLDATQDTSQLGIKAAIFNDIGEVVKAEFLVNTGDRDLDQGVPELAILKDGGFVITWSSLAAPHDNQNYGISGAIFEANGAVRVANFAVNDDIDGIQYFQQVIGLDTGEFIVAWRAIGDPLDVDGAIKGRIFKPDGTESDIGGEGLLNQRTDGVQSNVAVAALGGGNFVVSWKTANADQDGSGAAIKAVIFGVGGGIGTEFVVNSLGVGSQIDPEMVLLKSGGFVTTWTSLDANQDGDESAIKSQIFEVAPVHKFANNSAREFHIITDGNGGQLGNVVISDIPTGVSFNIGFLDGTTLTLAQDQLDDLNIILDNSVKGRYELDISVASIVNGVEQTSHIKVQISIGKSSIGDAGSNTFADNSAVQHIDGKVGTDTFTFSGVKADYTFKISGIDIAVIHNDDLSHIDLIHSIEKLQFNDGGPAVDVFALDDLGDISELSGDAFDAWLLQNYDHQAF